MNPYENNLTVEECKEYLDNLRARKIQPYQPIHLYPDFVTKHKGEGFRLRIDSIKKALGDLDGKHVLDLGCAVGWNLFELAFEGTTGVGVDVSKNSIHTASCLAKVYELEDKTIFYHMNVVDYVKETDEYFDCIMPLNVLNHVIDQIGYDEGWKWMNLISTKCDSIITNYYGGVDQHDKNLLKYTEFKNCEVVLKNTPYYNNMGRRLYRLWNK